MKPFLWIWGIFSFGWTFWNLWGYHQKNEKFSAALSLRKPIFTHPVLDSEPVTLSSQPHSSWLMSWQWFCAGTPSTQKKKKKERKTQNWPSPLPVFVSSAVGANLPSWLCFSQHVVARLDSSRYFSASWSLPLLRRGRRARLSSAKLRLEVSSISLSNWSSWNCEGKEKQLADIFPSYMQRLSWQPAHEQLCSHSAAQNSESIWAMTHLLQFCLRLWLWCV